MLTLLCPYCFTDSGLRRRLIDVRPKFDEGQCSHHPSRKGIPIEAVGAIVDEVFRANFTFGGADIFYEDDPLGPHPEYGPQRGQPLYETVYELVEPENDEIAQQLIDQLVEDDSYWPSDGEEAFYRDDIRYERIEGDDHGHGAMWQRVCQTILHEQRYFNPEVGELLKEIFKFIHLQRTAARLYPIYVLKPEQGRRLFRARVVEDGDISDVVSEPATHLGPPPRRKGRSNRMNAAGIGAFYASFDLRTCVSEIRPIVGDQVATVEFELIREIVVLDMTRFAAPPKELNLFAKDHVRRLAQWRFMQKFMAEIAKPIAPEHQHLDYVPTQAVAEYLNKIHEIRIAKSRRQIDAILFNSAQHPSGTNIVVLGDAAAVRGVAKSKASLNAPSFNFGQLEGASDPAPSLAVIEDTLRVRRVNEAAYDVDNGYRPWVASPYSPTDPF